MKVERSLERTQRRMLLTALTALALLVVTVWLLTRGPAGPSPVHGVLLEVRGTQIAVPDSIRLRDDTGQEWLFMVDPSVTTDPTHPTNAAHLRAHLAVGDPVTVYYRMENGSPRAYRIVDNP